MFVNQLEYNQFYLDILEHSDNASRYIEKYMPIKEKEDE